MHVGVFTTLGLVYRVQTRHWPREERVGALDYLGAMLVMPVTYLLLTPLALFTLDTGNWETRGRPHEALQPEPPAGVHAGDQP